ncbi:hypothetical protein NQ317_016158 [Molorchus minor]|uniref:Uncharacterized protein n=1 Tax=Molorchus minor TaxID=1323400 RepID=A0ABQ9IXZ1_9CUCU|nr:hypothetical protein NQ317_016158 [Molorchus minor]
MVKIAIQGMISTGGWILESAEFVHINLHLLRVYYQMEKVYHSGIRFKAKKTPRPGREHDVIPFSVFVAYEYGKQKMSDSQISKEAVELLYKYWSEHKFSVQCQSHIYLLLNHLVANNIEGAKSVKGYLLTDFKDECKDWLEEQVNKQQISLW